VAYGASFVEWFAEEAKRVNGQTLPTFDNNKRLTVIQQPIGVCAAITPWNFPLAMITRKVAPALAAGCTVVIKPAELTPLTALAAAELAQRAGLPAGVINVVTGMDAPAIGQVLCESEVVRHLSFTGSTEVGRILAAQCAPTVKSWRWSWAATRPSSCSTTPTWTRPSKARWPASTATPARPACAPTACTCKTACTTPSSRSWRPRSRA
jgi:acyl-CoA reductase-like NAD-dependent aldehyde dehydrogenase